MTSLGTISARAIGVVAGLALCLCVVEASQVEPSIEPLGLHLDVTLAGTGALAVQTNEPLVQVRNLLPGENRFAEGVGEVRNETGRSMAVRVRAVPSTVEVDEMLNLEVFAGERLLYKGTLAGLRDWTAESFEVGVAEVEKVLVRAALAPGVTGGYQGRMERITIEMSGPQRV